MALSVVYTSFDLRIGTCFVNCLITKYRDSEDPFFHAICAQKRYTWRRTLALNITKFLH